jgi:hypothetical protein
MDYVSKRAFRRLCKKLREAGTGSSYVRQFIMDEHFAMNQLEIATEELAKEETENIQKKRQSGNSADGFGGLGHIF